VCVCVFVCVCDGARVLANSLTVDLIGTSAHMMLDAGACVCVCVRVCVRVCVCG